MRLGESADTYQPNRAKKTAEQSLGEGIKELLVGYSFT